jgi:hypothetical protein
MRIYHRFHAVWSGFFSRFAGGLRFWLAGLALGLAMPMAGAAALEAQVAGAQGGQIAIAPSGGSCLSSCAIQTSAPSIVSLFAVPDPGYRFQGWEGACASTIGPLCTLASGENLKASAHFAKADAPLAQAKVLLLLHGEGASHTVWNEFVKQRFNDRCPVVYGGVALGEDAINPHNNVYCYRIDFGYYDALNRSLAPPAPQEGRGAGSAFSGKRWGYEVRAAVLGILERHPNLSLVLAGEGRGILAARSFLLANTAERDGVIGFLALQPPRRGCKDPACEQRWRDMLQALHTAALKLAAEPEDEAAISAALATLAKPWWMER